MPRKLLNEELNRIDIKSFRESPKTPLVIILDNVRSMNNIGSVFRSSDAFLVEKIYLCGITACPPHKDIHKTALGATESVEWEYSDDTLGVVKKLREQGYFIVSIEQAEGSIPLNEFNPAIGEKYAVILGHEVRGVQQEVVNTCDATIEIAQFGTKHSLNISVCAGIVIWDFFNKLSIAKKK